MKHFFNKISLMILVALCLLNSCRKKDDEKILLLGKWKHINYIYKYTTVNPINNEKTEVSDTFYLSDMNFNSHIEFKKDTLYGTIRIGNHIHGLNNIPYVLDKNDLIFYSNPFNLYGMVDPSIRTSCKIKHLSRNELTLYDFHPLSSSGMTEVWHHFRRE